MEYSWLKNADHREVGPSLLFGLLSPPHPSPRGGPTGLPSAPHGWTSLCLEASAHGLPLGRHCPTRLAPCVHKSLIKSFKTKGIWDMKKFTKTDFRRLHVAAVSWRQWKSIDERSPVFSLGVNSCLPELLTWRFYEDGAYEQGILLGKTLYDYFKIKRFYRIL